MTVLPTRRLLPLLMFMAFIMLGQRGYDFWSGLQYGEASHAQEPAAPAHGQEAKPAVAEPKEAAPAATAATPASHSEAPARAESAAASTTSPADTAPEMPVEYTPAEVKVLQALSQRRADLDKRAAELDQREALIAVTESKVEDKVKELQALRTELQNLLHTVDQQQQARIASLVKLYETMKPQEAAAILETLELPVALDILGQMKETKSAPILAKMSPQKASEITVEMSRRSQLPQIPQ